MFCDRSLAFFSAMIGRPAALLLLLSIGAAPGHPLPRPAADIEKIFRDFVIEYVTLRPEAGTAMGLPAAYRIYADNGALDDESDAGVDRLFGLYRKYHGLLAECCQDDLPASQRAAAELLMWYLENELRGEKFRDHAYVINPMLGFHNSFTTLMTEHHRIESEADALDYIERLKGVRRKASQLARRMEKQRARGIIPPLCVVENCRQLLESFIGVDHTSNPLYTAFADRLTNIPRLSARSRQKLCDQVVAALKTDVYPAYRSLIEHLDVAHQAADDRAGVWKLPDGDEYYRYCLRSHTTADLTPDEIHELGLAEVARIQGRLMDEFRNLGIPAGDDFAAMLNAYNELAGDRTDERFFFAATEQGRTETLEAYQAAIDAVERRLPELFSRIPRARVRAMAVPEFKEQMIGTYYQPPKLDGSEPGIFYVNLSYQHSKAGVRALAYHEALPGHHLQMALEQEAPDARLFKAIFFFTGYVEGWALYAEKLAGEQGMYDDILSRIGYLRSELFRAARLVVDTGIHHRQWTREQAYYYFLDNIGWAAYDEIDRYILWPGQACAYKVGELKLLELREKARTGLGDRFDLRAFHDAVLQHGSVPFALLERIVDDHIAAARNL